MTAAKKVGIISCNGEEYAGGAIARLATRRVLESIRPGITVTLCSPLFFSWEEEARAFLEAYSVITVDGCPKRCTMRVRQMLTRKKVKSVVVSDLIGAELALKQPFTQRDFGPEWQAAAEKVTVLLTATIDSIFENQAYYKRSDPF